MSVTDAQRRQRRLAARARWGSPRVVRLDTLDPAVQRAIRALVEANEKAAPVIVSPETAGAEGHGDDRTAA